MNRREMLSAFIASAGVSEEAFCKVDKEPEPILFILELPEGEIGQHQLEHIQACWLNTWKGNPIAPLYITPPGCKFSVAKKSILDSERG